MITHDGLRDTADKEVNISSALYRAIPHPSDSSQAADNLAELSLPRFNSPNENKHALPNLRVEFGPVNRCNS